MEILRELLKCAAVLFYNIRLNTGGFRADKLAQLRPWASSDSASVPPRIYKREESTNGRRY